MTNTTPFALTPEISTLVTGALDSGNVLLLAAVDRDRKPLLSFRGSTAVFSGTQLSFWARNAAGGTLEAISENPNVALMYRSKSVPLLQFIGRARITDDPTERDRVFNLAHEKERASDPERKGRAVIVDLDEVKGVLGFGKDGPIYCHLSRG
ncbi:MAG: pyridoxamine 5'-phosphate oxidase family protein [Steroidobacteraceae bacterium]